MKGKDHDAAMVAVAAMGGYPAGSMCIRSVLSLVHGLS